ncbi:putative aminopeptidase NPEPL1 [Orchesella cincta]|uniref:Putative aminopeptidase NPEPL1 n=1 Tax=Orchesella cincta TaxID=48709 RepID=A0A1D2NJF6_ORCCI|nr:putative aminopeptidase NPEPL1 [Orchesella cincta]
MCVLQPKLAQRVTEEVYKHAIETLNPCPTDSIPLYLNKAALIGLPKTCSRHNTPSRAHSLSSMIKASLVGGNGSASNENIVIVCEKPCVFALGCAVARVFPLYDRKSLNKSVDGAKSRTVNVEFLLVKKDDCSVYTADKACLSTQELECLQDAATAIRNTARLIDMPTNELHTDAFVEEAKVIATELGITPVVIKGEELKTRGFGGLYSVGKAAEHPPALVVLSHRPPGAKKNIAWVGKGIVFDTGGLSMKTKETMPGMKGDMGGAAAILNAFYLAVKQGFKENLHAILCIAENSVGPLSTRPDDVIIMYSKKSVEVNNTDAEGRLVVGDGVVYAKNDLQCDIIVDMCTLTSAQLVSTGKNHGAVLTNSEQYEKWSVDAGRASGDLVFPIVFTPEFHFPEFTSAVADMKNSVANRNNATSSCAGLWIMSQLGFDFPGVWVHFDMGGPSTVGERASGYGVSLLNTLFGKLSCSKLLNEISRKRNVILTSCCVNTLHSNHLDGSMSSSLFSRSFSRSRVLLDFLYPVKVFTGERALSVQFITLRTFASKYDSLTDKMSNTVLKFHPGGGNLIASDPQTNPVIILGQLPHLEAVPYSTLKSKLAPRVTEEIFQQALETLNPSPTDSIPLYLQKATILCLPKTCSRHNTPSRAHSLTKLIKTSHIGGNGSQPNENILVVCEKRDVFALGCAVAKAFPLYSRKSSSKSTNADGSKKEPRIVNVEFLTVSKTGGEFALDQAPLTAQEIGCLQDAVTAIRNTARLVDTPANELHTDAFVEEAKAIANELGITPVIIQGEELKQKGFGGIYGVGKASEHPPALVVLSHRPPGASKNIAWVGKGIVFDTGGLSIKSKTGMCCMKRDCGGAAGILNAFYLAVKQGFTENLHAVLCLAENSVGPLSTRPDDVLIMYSKKSVEINNTDAEGRLVLADGVVYAKNDLGCDVIVDMATLTGAQGIATGKYHSAVLTNSEQFEKLSVEAGKVSGELVFPIVYTPEFHFSEFSSAVADMKNSVADRGNAQSSCAGLFIMSHLGFDFPGAWVHLDIASPAELGERATGYGVALLNTMFGSLSSSDLLKGIAPNPE